MTDQPANPKIEIDDSWKQQAAAEKEKLSGQAGQGAAKAAPQPAASENAAAAPSAGDSGAAAGHGARQIPPASFDLMIEEYVTQILISLGAVPHPSSGKRMRDMGVAKHYIDMLAVLEAKTKGNLTADEENLLSTALYQSRMHYVNAARGR